MYFIRLDKKGRLVLPSEIREALGVETNGKMVISVSTAQPKFNSINLSISRASDSQVANSISFSKNGKYLKGEVKL